MRILAIVFFAVFLMISRPAAADTYTNTLLTITDMNRIQPLQNPEYETSARISARRVTDSKNKVVGEVRDVILNKNGSISSLQIEFDRLGLGTPVYMDYSANRIDEISNGYALRFEDDQIEELYPSMLAGIETAAGEQQDTFSVQKLKGAAVMTKDGRKIGNVQEVLFNKRGRRAEALLLAMLIGGMRGETLAIPIGMTEIEPASGKVKATIENKQADAIIDYAKEK